MNADTSEGWDAVADAFVAARSNIGATLVLNWARESLSPKAAIVDIGCGSGTPIARSLIDDGFTVCGIDASPRLLRAFARHCPDMPRACEPAQDSRFFDRRFDGAIAIGLLFLLDVDQQRRVLEKAAAALDPGGRLLFSAPLQACTWEDTLTSRPSRSLGADAYAEMLAASGLHLVRHLEDEGANTYYDAIKPAA